MALPFCWTKVKILRFSYTEIPCRPSLEIILPLHGKAVTGGFLTHFEL